MLPFSQAQFFGVFTEYNTAIWPLQPVAAILGVSLVLMLRHGPRWRHRAVAAILAGLWLTMGVGYHWAFFAPINSAAYAFGLLFVCAGLLFLVEGVVRRRVEFEWAGGVRGWFAAALILYGLIVYPAVSLLYLHPYPATPLFGVAPCPTTIFTLGILLLSRYRRPLALSGIPLVWSVIGGSAAILLHVPQDWGLFAAAVAWLAVYATERTHLQPRRPAA